MSPLNRTTASFDKKWTSYALAGGAMFLLPVASIASPITLYSPGAGDVQSADLDVDGDTVIDFTFTADGTPGGRSTFVTGTGTNMVEVSAINNNLAKALFPGDVVDGTSTFGSTGIFLYDTAKVKPPNTPKIKGKWTDDINQTSYLGLEFQISGSTHYGWAAVSAELGSASLDVTAFGYETAANTGITIPGGVPEPSSMALMLLGAAGIATLKLRRRSESK